MFELIKSMENTKISMAKTAELMRHIKDDETVAHGKELLGASVILDKWINEVKKLESM